MSDEQKPQCPKWELPSEEEQMLEEAAVTIQVAKEQREAVVAEAVAQARLEEAIEWSAMALNMSPEGFRVWCRSRIAALEAALKGEGTGARP